MSDPRSVHRAAEPAWILYDAGNSAFVLVMVTAIMPVFFKDVAATGMADTRATALWGAANAASALLLAILAPFLGALADYSGNKRRLFMVFLLMGLGFTLSLTLVGQGMWLICMVLFVMARLGWSGANLLYDAFLVDVAPASRLDRLSARGYAWGYIGSVVPFVLILLIIRRAGTAGGEALPVQAVHAGFVLVVIWWGALSLPMLFTVRQVHSLPPTDRVFRDTVVQLGRTLSAIRSYRPAFTFLLAYFFYIDGVGTIISMAAVYGRDLGFGINRLTLVILMIQIIAFPCALVYGRLADRFSPYVMLQTGIGIYCGITLLAFFLPDITDPGRKEALFWVIAVLVGSAMGGIQALSRSFFARLIPREKSGAFFGLFNVFGKFAAITGPLMMGGIAAWTGHSRWGVLSLLLLFDMGGLLLARTRHVT